MEGSGKPSQLAQGCIGGRAQARTEWSFEEQTRKIRTSRTSPALVFQLSGSGAAVSPRFKRFERRGPEQHQERDYALVAESWRERRTSDPQNKGVVARR
jgi:hypothetical protein